MRSRTMLGIISANGSEVVSESSTESLESFIVVLSAVAEVLFASEWPAIQVVEPEGTWIAWYSILGK